MTTMLGGVSIVYVGAGEWHLRCGDTEVRVMARDVSTVTAVGRTLAVESGAVGGVVGPPCDCPICDSIKTRVVDSRPVGDAIRRRRKCRKCGVRWTTEERTMSIGKNPILGAEQ